MGRNSHGMRTRVRVRPDPGQIAVVADLGTLDRWVEAWECIEEEAVMPTPPDAPLPRPGRDDAESLCVLSDQLEELGLDAGAALLRDVAGRIERDVEVCEEFAEFERARLAELKADNLRLIKKLQDTIGLYSP
jgi:hypothetical protein